MDIHKISHEICEVAKHGHLPLLASLIGTFRISRKAFKQEENSDLEEVTGDNILPNEILISLSSRRGL